MNSVQLLLTFKSWDWWPSPFQLKILWLYPLLPSLIVAGFTSVVWISNALLDENVDMCLVLKYFTSDAWMLIEDVIKNKSENIVWTCHSCHHDLHSEQSIICDACLLWFNFRFVGLTKLPKAKKWYCRPCHSKVN